MSSKKKFWTKRVLGIPLWVIFLAYAVVDLIGYTPLMAAVSVGGTTAIFIQVLKEAFFGKEKPE